jgi:hypothetical protein
MIKVGYAAMFNNMPRVGDATRFLSLLAAAGRRSASG